MLSIFKYPSNLKQGTGSSLNLKLKMASSDSQDVEPPRKKQRLCPPQPSTSTTTTRGIESKAAKMDDTIKQTVMSDNGFQPERETQAGILHYVNSKNLGFTGTLKQRYVLRVFLFNWLIQREKNMFNYFESFISVSFTFEPRKLAGSRSYIGFVCLRSRGCSGCYHEVSCIAHSF